MKGLWQRLREVVTPRVLAVTAGVYVVAFAAATVFHLYLDRLRWVMDEESAMLWDWTAAIRDTDVCLATVNDGVVLALFTGLLLFRKLRCPWAAWLCGAWGVTWVFVALVCTGDLTRSVAGPMNIPWFVFVFPMCCLLCLLEGGVLLLLRAVDRNTPRARHNRVVWKNRAKESKGSARGDGHPL